MDDLVDERYVLMTFNRRSFFKLTGATILSSCVGAVGLGACSSWRDDCEVPLAPARSYQLDGDQVILSLPAVSALAKAGGAVRLVFREDEQILERLIIVHSEVGQYHVFADHCTHNDKELYYLHELKILRCHSGKSHFNLDGSVIKGPAEKSLHVFTAWQEDSELMIEMMNGVSDVRSSYFEKTME